MRQEDVEELLHFSGNDPLKALQSGLAYPDYFTIELDGRAVVMFGCGGEVGSIGFIFMLASDDLVYVRKTMHRESIDFVKRMRDKYSYLTNWAWAKNDVHVEWLKRLGFQLDAPAPLPWGSTELFIRFHGGTHV